MIQALTGRIIKDRAFGVSLLLLSFLAIMPLLFILFYIVRNGVSSIRWEFLASLPAPVGEPGGGISNAIIGTCLLIILASVVSVPVGVTAGLYLSENRESRLSSTVRLCVEVLQGVPSIVIGIVAYAWMVVPLRAFSALSGAVALGIMMIPVVVKATEETLVLVPYSLKEACLALGAPYYRTILKVIVPSGLSGILTGILLGISRIAGETAPLLFTAFGSPFMALDIFRPVNALPLVIFNYAKSPYPDWHAQAWGASLILIILVLALNLTARIASVRWKVQF